MTRAARLAGLLAVIAPLAAAGSDFSICYDFGCKSRTQVAFTSADWAAIETTLGAADSAAAERKGIARAVAAFERIVGARTPTALDKGGNLAGSGMPGQMDCIDESHNTTAFLQVLERRGLLRWHTVAGRVKRVSWFLFAHWTAVVQERGGARYAVDSWPRDNGMRPDVQRLRDWIRHREPEHPASLSVVSRK